MKNKYIQYYVDISFIKEGGLVKTFCPCLVILKSGPSLSIEQKQINNTIMNFKKVLFQFSTEIFFGSIKSCVYIEFIQISSI